MMILGEWIGRVTIVELATLPDSVNRVNVSPIRFPMAVLKDQQQNPKASMETKQTQNNHKVSCREKKARDSTKPDLKKHPHKTALGAEKGITWFDRACAT